MSESDEQNRRDTPDIQELLRWLIRYVLMPLLLAVVAGLFALEVTRLASAGSPSQDASSGNEIVIMTVISEQQTVVTATGEPIAEPTATFEPTQDTAVVSERIAPAPLPNCGQVPFGWQRYTVRPGNTLFSLAQSSGTTIGAIRQANCLYGQLLAYQQIWLPPIFDVRPIEPPVEVTVIVEEPPEEPPIEVTVIVEEPSEEPPIEVTVIVEEPIVTPDPIDPTPEGDRGSDDTNS